MMRSTLYWSIGFLGLLVALVCADLTFPSELAAQRKTSVTETIRNASKQATQRLSEHPVVQRLLDLRTRPERGLGRQNKSVRRSVESWLRATLPALRRDPLVVMTPKREAIDSTTERIGISGPPSRARSRAEEIATAARDHQVEVRVEPKDSPAGTQNYLIEMRGDVRAIQDFVADVKATK